jgi:hypothetical protein
MPSRLPFKATQVWIRRQATAHCGQSKLNRAVVSLSLSRSDVLPMRAPRCFL